MVGEMDPGFDGDQGSMYGNEHASLRGTDVVLRGNDGSWLPILGFSQINEEKFW